jgi:hypothetical protein
VTLVTRATRYNEDVYKRNVRAIFRAVRKRVVQTGKSFYPALSKSARPINLTFRFLNSNHCALVFLNCFIALTTKRIKNKTRQILKFPFPLLADIAGVALPERTTRRVRRGLKRNEANRAAFMMKQVRGIVLRAPTVFLDDGAWMSH